MTGRQRWFWGIFAGLAGAAHVLPQSAQQGLSVGSKTVALFAAGGSSAPSNGVLSIDTWVEGLPGSDFSESVYADFSLVDGESGAR